MTAKPNPHACGTAAQLSGIAKLNDAFRRSGTGGQLVVTAGVIGLAQDALPTVLAEVQQFTAFTSDNDPYGEHDFGAFRWQGERLFWKVDYYDRGLRFGSPDPADPAVTARVLTIMLASEY